MVEVGRVQEEGEEELAIPIEFFLPEPRQLPHPGHL